MTVRTKLLLAQLPLALSLLVVGAVSRRTVMALGHNAEDILKDNQLAVLAAQRMRDAADTMADALRVSHAPVIFSHSSARAICDHPRNVPDDILRQVTANGGVVMVNFYPNFLVPEGGKQATELYALERQLEDAHPGDLKAVEAGMAGYRKSHPLPKATIKLVADHVDHIKQVAGVDHVGIGSDFDGIDITPEGLEDVSKYPALTAELLSRGWSDEDVKKFLGLNVLRAMRQAEAVAASMKSEPPSVAMLPTATESTKK